MKNLPKRKLIVMSLIFLASINAARCKNSTDANYPTTKDNIEVTTNASPATELPSTQSNDKLLHFTLTPLITTSITKDDVNRTIERASSESTTTMRTNTKAPTTAKTKSVTKSARKQKLNTTSSGFSGGARSRARFQDHLGATDCDLPLLPHESRLWRGNETHELNLPVTMSEECGAGSPGGGGGEEGCPPMVVSWEGTADIQSGDILIVRIADPLLLDSAPHVANNNETEDSNSINAAQRAHRASVQPAVYQVTRQGHLHCDVTDGMLLDITPLDENDAKLFTLYDKDLTEGVNLLIVVAENWGSQCVRLKVTVKSDNCGESQECSGNGVCYTNVSMEGYECQCCRGHAGPHCEERAACSPSPCLNNGICVDLTQPLNGASYHCLCPYGFTGRKCEKDPCYSAPCSNGGSCMSMAVNGSTTFHCACSSGWSGPQCEQPVSKACTAKPCAHGICVEEKQANNGKNYRCFCEPGYTGEHCEVEYNECESSPCLNGGTCTDRVAGFTCACGRGYAGNACQLKVNLCSPNPCSENHYCVDRGNSYTCECIDCNIPPRSPCDNNPCAHGGTCWSSSNSFYCSCRPGYTGKLCEEDFILEPVVEGEVGEMGVGEAGMRSEGRAGGVRELRLPLGLYHDRLHNVYIAAGTLGAAIAIVGVVVTACHCRVNKTYARLLSRLSRVTEGGPPHHWLQEKRGSAPPAAPPAAPLDTADMYYTLDFSDSQSSPLIQ
ncbi:delta and Notch-like epidermal growth factor-related receptor [Papilio machaon]|uniref:delta and Notch-like epidermal growth factor-related receptor n=1 Tax=Papilio machaon TaxID=76193 RepID=UPI001E66388C|nr:delta and Notch-like epidermal growth factor-related receptor [Papilio machaon]